MIRGVLVVLVMSTLSGRTIKIVAQIHGPTIIVVLVIGFSAKNIKKVVQAPVVMIIINGKIIEIVQIMERFVRMENVFQVARMSVLILANINVLAHRAEPVAIMTQILV